MDGLERVSLEALATTRKKRAEWTPEQHKMDGVGRAIRNLRWRYYAYSTYDKLVERVKLKQQIEELAVDGKVAVYTWNRDCDLYESEYMTIIPATVIAFERYEDDMYKNAEGPFVIYLNTMEAFHAFHPTHRDRAAEMMNY